MNQVQVLGIIRKNKSHVVACGAIQIPTLEIEYLMEDENDEYQLERIRVVLDNPALKSWFYANKGSLIYIIGKGVWLEEELVISANTILLVRDHTGKAGATLLFQYGTHMNQFFISGQLEDPDALISDPIILRGGIDTYKKIPLVPKTNDNGNIQKPPYLICGKPSRTGVVL